MGAVLRGRDVDLGRDLAVKVLLEAHSDKPDLVCRFLEEAQIGGQLQHPGIVPVYELGRSAEQRPYFTMKLVHGRTLQEHRPQVAEAVAQSRQDAARPVGQSAKSGRQAGVEGIGRDGGNIDRTVGIMRLVHGLASAFG